MATLVLHNVSKNFKKKPVLKNISFSLETGEILGLFGRNGSGKSTLLKILFGNVKADTFSVALNDNALTVSEVIKKQHIAYLPQHPFLPKSMKVRDVIIMFHPNEKEQDAVFYDPHIATMTHKKTGELSLGELKYFEVVLLSQLPHPFIMLDEPFSMLEPLHKEKLKSILKKIKKTKGIIITDHYYHDVLEIATKNIIIKDGIALTVNNVKDLQAFKYLSR
ncbi:ABC transporter ATP-binding protein [unidentified eubacterium SCB49]|nr:ABC transporter ATP-binding protein [unidentified eubacterium SCB49]